MKINKKAPWFVAPKAPDILYDEQLDHDAIHPSAPFSCKYCKYLAGATPPYFCLRRRPGSPQDNKVNHLHIEDETCPSWCPLLESAYRPKPPPPEKCLACDGKGSTLHVYSMTEVPCPRCKGTRVEPRAKNT